MLHPWSNSNIEVRRSVSPLTMAAGLALVTIGIADSPVSVFNGINGWGFGMVLLAASSPISGSEAVGYLLHRDSGLARALHPSLAYGVTAALLLVGLFGLATASGPEVGGIPGVENAETGIIAAAILVPLVGAFLRNRHAGGRRFAVLGLLGWCLLVGWVVLAAGGPSEAAAPAGPFSAFGAVGLSVAVS